MKTYNDARTGKFTNLDSAIKFLEEFAVYDLVEIDIEVRYDVRTKR